MLQFSSNSDLLQVWSAGLVKLNVGTVRLIKWTPGFSPSTYRNTFAQVWVKLWDLGFDFWDPQTLFEIASGLGVPIKIDPKTLNRSVGLYARLLVDVDVSQTLPSNLRVERENGEAEVFEVEYERCPQPCNRCGLLGH